MKNYIVKEKEMKTINFEDCEFYTVQNIPGLSKPTEGEWDLRKNVDAYLGNQNLSGKTVLELGPASGFLTFHMESKGALVTSIELDLKKNKCDVVPYCNTNWEKAEEKHRINDMKLCQNAYWF